MFKWFCCSFLVLQLLTFQRGLYRVMLGHLLWLLSHSKLLRLCQYYVVTLEPKSIYTIFQIYVRQFVI